MAAMDDINQHPVVHAWPISLIRLHDYDSNHENAELAAVASTRSMGRIGKQRVRFPVAAKIALHKAGVNASASASPTALTGTPRSVGTMWSLSRTTPHQTCATG
jgi:hypothetical protein